MTSQMKSNPILNIINNTLIELPCPSNISSMWNFGSLLGLALGVQIITGLILSMNYAASVLIAFDSVDNIMRNINYGWLIRLIHANGASFFFFCIYMHIGRGIYYGSFYLEMTWMVGVSILLATMATAFLGYVLPWGQMSLWGATVITNLFSVIPLVGKEVVWWMWGGFIVNNATLNRFFALHFLLPFVIFALVMIHLLYLHQTGSNNPLGLNSNYDKISFHSYFVKKDLMGFAVFFIMLLLICFLEPWTLGDVENFIPANPIVTPLHIQPEWYFLFAYAILRSIPNKVGGVLALLFAVLMLYTFPFMKKSKFQGLTYYPMSQYYYWFWLNSIFILTWIGARPVEEPFITIGQIFTCFYFSYFFLFNKLFHLWDIYILK